MKVFTDEIYKALAWLEKLAALQETDSKPYLTKGGNSATRIYTHEEEMRLDIECRGFLMFLEQINLLDGATREMVIDGNEIDAAEFCLEDLKWCSSTCQVKKMPMHKWKIYCSTSTTALFTKNWIITEATVSKINHALFDASSHALADAFGPVQMRLGQWLTQQAGVFIGAPVVWCDYSAATTMKTNNREIDSSVFRMFLS